MINDLRLAILVTIFLAAGFETAFPQQSEIGFNGGLNIYSLNFSDNHVTGNRSVLHYGFIGRFYPEKIAPLSLQTELIYSPQGVKLRSENSLIRLDHVNVPILFQYKFDNDILVQAGPQLGFLMNAWADQDAATYDLKNRFRKVDLSLSAGLSYPLMSNGLGIDIRYNLGLSKISTDSFYRSRNRGLKISLFYLFDFSNHSSR
ncbi:porin family protein [Rhodohalobacter sp.]|uniref:porin family protein n=1 Tax=Rhodohalobacter sp. TaxID=1974210 RepID=UPI002ACDF5E4|nr:porin family protein [Rhodohalobacter sp.]MDZ7755926.1 porin family protein [Rhodohalobacter sp.]MDZ7757174.1 porin family protein [Rhodohalobacter sp.]